MYFDDKKHIFHGVTKIKIFKNSSVFLKINEKYIRKLWKIRIHSDITIQS